jgi:hypothetical protein
MASLQRQAVFDERPDHSKPIRRIHREPEIQICFCHFVEGVRNSTAPGGEATLTALFESGHATRLAHSEQGRRTG